eukprot:gene4500-8952_t
MFGLLTTLTFMQSAFVNHLEVSNMRIIENLWMGSMGFISYSHPDKTAWKYIRVDETSCIFAFDNKNVPDESLLDFLCLNISKSFTNQFISKEIFHPIHENLIGSNPLFYSIASNHIVTNKTEFIISNDYFGMKHANFNKILNVGADVLSNFPNFKINEKNYTIEIENTDMFSLLVDCAMDTVGLNRHVRYTRAHIMNQYDIIEDDSMRKKIFDSFKSFAYETAMAWEPTLLAVATESWNLCEGSSSTKSTSSSSSSSSSSDLSSSILLSYHAGFMQSLVKVYFQNYFCYIMDVEVEYPLKDLNFQRALFSTAYPSSYLFQSLHLLKEAHYCNIQEIYQPKTFSIGDKSSTVCSNYNCIDEYKSPTQSSTTSPTSNAPSTSKYSTSTSTNSNSIGRLYSIAKKIASVNNEIVLIQATEGYLDLLQNFFCYALEPSVNTTNILVLTPDEAVMKFTKLFGIESYLIENSENSTATGGNAVDFGTLAYQELILQRSGTVLQLLYFGFKVIIADIDMVWMRNPMEAIHDAINKNNKWNNSSNSNNNDVNNKGTYDILVTYDEDEICGCFLYINSTEHGISFWKTLVAHHQNIVLEAMDNSGRLTDFFASEQKILTKLLLDPLGSYKDPNTSMPVLSMLLPIHHSYVQTNNNNYDGNITTSNTSTGLSSNRITVQVHIEGGPEASRPSGKLWISSDPPMFLSFEHFLVYELSLSQLYNRQLMTFTMILDDSNIAVTSDIIIVGSSSYDGASSSKQQTKYIDFNSNINIQNIANNRIRKWKFSQKIDFTSDNNNNDDDDMLLLDTLTKRKENMRHEQVPTGAGTTSNSTKGTTAESIQSPPLTTSPSPPLSSSSVDGLKLKLKFSIRVLAYNRPQSLLRLLTSLATDSSKVFEVQQLAREFAWPHGEKNLLFREENVGLLNQWYDVWSPEDPYELSFILEDDTEVSPLYFQWARKAALQYYTSSNSIQLQLHENLLEAVQNYIAGNGERATESNLTVLEMFAQSVAGYPLMSGICLQKQHLDAVHYPRRVDIRNNNKPFLYSLVGSWGPLMFPIFWKSFKLWLQWRVLGRGERDGDGDGDGGDGQQLPHTPNLVVNTWMRNSVIQGGGHHSLWTPWHIRFSYEIGAKCLYSNLEGTLALVTNHREIGVNYAEHKGSSSELLQHQHHHQQSHHHSFMSNLYYFSKMEELIGFQYDFALNRLGSYADMEHLSTTTSSSAAPPPNASNDNKNNNNNNNKNIGNDILQQTSQCIKNQNQEQCLDDSISSSSPQSSSLPLFIDIKHWYQSLLQLDSSSTSSSTSKSTTYDEHLLQADYKLCISESEDNYEILMLNLLQIQNYNKIVQDVLSHLHKINYIIVIGNCASAPSDFTISQQHQHQQPLPTECSQSSPLEECKEPDLTNNSKIDSNFTLIDRICEVGNGNVNDIGASIYIRLSEVESSSSWYEERYGIISRIANSLIRTRMIARRKIMYDV